MNFTKNRQNKIMNLNICLYFPETVHEFQKDLKNSENVHKLEKIDVFAKYSGFNQMFGINKNVHDFKTNGCEFRK